MMETQEELTTEIGTAEPERQMLKPKRVKIVSVKIVVVEKAKSKKIVCEVKHPDREEVFSMSSVAYLLDKQIVNKGLWFNKDKEGKIQKNSALAVFLEKMGVKTISSLAGKEADTEMDGNYLCFKAY
jgi:hypothetical protein